MRPKGTGECAGDWTGSPLLLNSKLDICTCQCLRVRQAPAADSGVFSCFRCRPSHACLEKTLVTVLVGSPVSPAPDEVLMTCCGSGALDNR
jgi:hypothetical protein